MYFVCAFCALYLSVGSGYNSERLEHRSSELLSNTLACPGFMGSEKSYRPAVVRTVHLPPRIAVHPKALGLCPIHADFSRGVV